MQARPGLEQMHNVWDAPALAVPAQVAVPTVRSVMVWGFAKYMVRHVYENA